jgi:hypothetical protein
LQLILVRLFLNLAEPLGELGRQPGARDGMPTFTPAEADTRPAKGVRVTRLKKVLSKNEHILLVDLFQQRVNLRIDSFS